jgi:hypothetical protein
MIFETGRQAFLTVWYWHVRDVASGLNSIITSMMNSGARSFRRMNEQAWSACRAWTVWLMR